MIAGQEDCVARYRHVDSELTGPWEAVIAAGLSSRSCDQGRRDSRVQSLDKADTFARWYATVAEALLPRCYGRLRGGLPVVLAIPTAGGWTRTPWTSCAASILRAGKPVGAIVTRLGFDRGGRRSRPERDVRPSLRATTFARRRKRVDRSRFDNGRVRAASRKRHSRPPPPPPFNKNLIEEFAGNATRRSRQDRSAKA